jgi:2-polyprenyl-3-methyl-5-hydroxy-6-metoxy-1,4-benzoquinol methylase
MSDDVERYYDITAERTAREWYPDDILLPTQRELMTLLPPHPRILDFGCGPGYEAMRLHSLGAEVTGIDISTESIRIARERNPACRFVRMDFLALDDSLGTFDAIWASGSLIHVAPERMKQVMMGMRKALSRKGILAAVIRDGSGKLVSHPVIEGAALDRTVYLYTKLELSEHGTSCGLTYLKEGCLKKWLADSGWRCHLYESAQSRVEA